METFRNWLFPAMWIAYIVYWRSMAPAADAHANERLEAASSRILRLVLFLSAFALLAIRNMGVPLLERRFLPEAGWCFWLGAAITASGLLFSVWARIHLGNNWSQAVTLKQDHQLIISGPYALVRHPIYTGLLTGFLGCAIARGQWRGLLAVASVAAMLWRKLLLEETWMQERFGDSYTAYCRRVARIVPYLI